MFWKQTQIGRNDFALCRPRRLPRRLRAARMRHERVISVLYNPGINITPPDLSCEMSVISKTFSFF